MSPREIKKNIGSQNWKLICKNKLTTNKKILSRLGQYRKGHEGELLKNVVNVCSNYNLNMDDLLSYMKYGTSLDVGVAAYLLGLKIHSPTFWVVYDTIHMCRELEESYKLDWSMRRWSDEHNRLTRIFDERDIKDIIGDYPIDKTFPKLKKIEGLLEYENVKPLLCGNDFIEESQAMKHCIFSYTNRAFDGDYLAISVDDGKERSTIGFNIKKGKKPQYQHTSIYNGGISPKRAALGKKIHEDVKNFLDKK